MQLDVLCFFIHIENVSKLAYNMGCEFNAFSFFFFATLYKKIDAAKIKFVSFIIQIRNLIYHIFIISSYLLFS